MHGLAVGGQVNLGVVQGVRVPGAAVTLQLGSGNVGGIFRLSQSSKQIIPFIKMVPNPEIAEKLGDVCIVAGNLTLEVDGSIIDMKFSPNNPIILKKNSYVSDLTSQGKADPVSLQLDDTSKIDVEVDIYLVGNTLETIEPIDLPPCSLVQDYSKLMPDSEEESKEKFCDVTITCPATTEATKNAVFYAHKAILAARSPVFARMFASGMKERATNTVDLSDIEPDVLKELLTYIYTGECPNIKAQAESLLYQAEKYDLSHLKALCEERLSYDLQIDNAARILLLADKCNANGLKNNSVLFINEHGEEVQGTKEWEEIKDSKELLHELLTTVYAPSAKRRKI